MRTKYVLLKKLLTLFIVTLLAIIAIAIFANYFISTNALQLSQSWLSQHSVLLALWRLALIAMVYLSWPALSKQAAKRHHYSESYTKQLIQCRLPFCLMLLLVDALLVENVIGKFLSFI